MVLDKVMKVKVKGKEYSLCYPIKAVIGAESELPEKSLFAAVNTPTMTNFFVLLKWGLIGGGMSDLTDSETEEIWNEILETESVDSLFKRMIVPALMKSGTFGKTEKKAQGQVVAAKK